MDFREVSQVQMQFGRMDALVVIDWIMLKINDKTLRIL